VDVNFNNFPKGHRLPCRDESTRPFSVRSRQNAETTKSIKDHKVLVR
jgi:hypothetical protein